MKIYHNPRCSKSRQTLQLLQDKGHSPEIIEYLKTPPTAQDVNDILTKLGLVSAREIMRCKEPEYGALELDASTLSEAELIDAIVSTPKLLERPIVVTQSAAAIGRPPENVLTLL